MAWSEEKKRAEVKKLLFFIYKEWRKDVTENMIDDWLVVLKGVRRSDVRLAALLLRRQKTYGEPKTQDLFDCIERVQKAKENFRCDDSEAKQIVKLAKEKEQNKRIENRIQLQIGG